jgi:hypothetical protein
MKSQDANPWEQKVLKGAPPAERPGRPEGRRYECKGDDPGDA